MDLTLLAVAVLVAAALTWWFMNPPRANAPTERRTPGPAGVAPRRPDRTPPAPPDDPARRRIVGLAAGVLLVLVVVLVFVLARYR